MKTTKNQPEIQANSSKSAKSERIKAHQFKPGVSGNPKGRPKGSTIWELVEKQLSKPIKRGSTKTKRELHAEEATERFMAFDPLVYPLMLKRLWPEVQTHSIQADLALSHEDAAKRLIQKLSQLAEAEEVEPEQPEPLVAGQPTYQPPPVPAKKGNGSGDMHVSPPVDDDDPEPEGIPERTDWFG